MTAPVKRLSPAVVKSLLSYNSRTGILRWRVGKFQGQVAGSAHSKGYWQVQIGLHKYLAHRLAWVIHYGRWPRYQLDHENRKRADNRIDNLRESDDHRNMHNAAVRRDSTSGCRGVSWHVEQRRWHAHITHRRRRQHLGSFCSRREAVRVRKAAEVAKGWAP